MLAHELSLSRYIVVARGSGTASVWSTRSGRIIDLDLAVLDRLLAGRHDEVPASIQDTLLSANILVARDFDERRAVLQENSDAALQDDDLDVILVPSSDCALGCNLKKFGSYCGQEHSKGRIDDVGEANILSFIDRSKRAHHKNLKITWFGGEPLLALDRVRSMSAALMRAAASHGLGYTASLVTGGTLLSAATARECYLKLGIASVSVTLDGLQDTHDARRPTKAGRPTFERIVANLQEIFADPQLEGLIIAIRCNVDKRNLPDAQDILNYMASKGWQDRVEMYAAAVHPWGDAASAQFLLSAQEFADWEIGWQRSQRALGFRLRGLPGRKKLVCRVVSTSRIVIGHDQTIHRCTESPLTPRNHATDRVGLVSSTNSIDAVPTWNWHEDVSEGRYPCSRCEYLPVCGGACPLSWRTGSDIPCPPFKHNGVEQLGLQREVAAEAAADIHGRYERSDYSIFGMLEALAVDKEDLNRARMLQERLKGLREDAATTDSVDIANELLKRTTATQSWEARKLENAAVLSTTAYLHYKASDIDGVITTTEAIIAQLQNLADNRTVDPRLSQIQALLNLLAAELKLVSTIDNPLASGLIGYLNGFHSLRLSTGHIRRLELSLVSKPVVRKMRRSLREIVDLTRISGCA